MIIYPAIDLINGRTVRLEQGRYDRKLSYDVSPEEAARRWVSMGAEYIHVIDLDGARAGEPRNLGMLKKIVDSAGDVPVQTGGGYRETAQIEKALEAGAARVILGSRAFSDRAFAEDSSRRFGKDIIFSVDARSGRIMSDGWEVDSGLGDTGMIKIFVEECGAEEIIYTDIEKDGMLSGPDIANLERLLGDIDIRIISAGGIRTVEHIKQLKKLEPEGLSGAVIGRALYEGTIDLKEAINAG